MLRDLASGLRTDLQSGKAVPALAAGLTSGLGLLVAQVAFGSFIFSGPLAEWVQDCWHGTYAGAPSDGRAWEEGLVRQAELRAHRQPFLVRHLLPQQQPRIPHRPLTPGMTAWEEGDCGRRAIRGGSWYGKPSYVRTANRFWYDTYFRNNNLGFRIARSLQE